MNTTHIPPVHRQAQSGSVLFVALILLLLASVVTLLALNVGMFEQRTSGNDARAKLIAEVAEAGIAQGAEYFRLRPAELLASSGRWQACGATDRSFPCGSIPDMLVDADGDLATVAKVQRRSTMYFWCNAGDAACNNGGSVDINNDGAKDLFDARMLPLQNVVPADARITSVGGFTDVGYGVGVVLCRVAIPKNPTDVTRCATVADEQSSTYVYNYVSVAQVKGEGTRTTVSQMLGQYAIFNAAPNKPPIIASGSVDVTGTLQIVANANAGGPGVPVSVWTRKDMQASGTPDTCYFDEFIRLGAQTSNPPKMEGGIVTCDTCSCAGHTLTAGSGNSLDEDIDILDIDGSNGNNNLGVNADVKLEEFPCDLFEFIFGKSARTDEDGDHFCEKRRPMESFVTPGNSVVPAPANVTVSLDADVRYLYRNADIIIPSDADIDGDGVADARKLMADKQFTSLTYPSSAFSGIVWCQKSCNIGAGTQMGTPEKPVLLVVDGSLSIQGRVFGMIFVRSNDVTLDPDTGGSAVLDMNAGAAVYGAVVVQGKINKANGTASVIFNSDVFKNLANSIPPKNSNLPGAWTDRLSY